jgi:hypothetical protein
MGRGTTELRTTTLTWLELSPFLPTHRAPRASSGGWRGESFLFFFSSPHTRPPGIGRWAGDLSR